MVIGNPFGLECSVTAGIVSAKGRFIGQGNYDDFLQTDAPINPGNSGGPLLDLEGRVIGINTSIFSRSGGNIGIGFAIPINRVVGLLPQLRAGKVTRGRIGVTLETGRLTGLEALIRWQHPTRGLLPPGAFIDAAVKTRARWRGSSSSTARRSRSRPSCRSQARELIGRSFTVVPER
jgi:S1-C subfamily serine protease